MLGPTGSTKSREQPADINVVYGGIMGAQLPRIDALDLSFSVGCVQRDSQRITINTQLLTLN